jgi:hypothetical protein
LLGVSSLSFKSQKILLEAELESNSCSTYMTLEYVGYVNLYTF